MNLFLNLLLKIPELSDLHYLILVIRNRRASYQDNVLPSMIEQVPKLTRGGTIAPNSKSKSKTSRLLSVLPGTSPGTLVVGDSHKFPSIKITAYNLDVLEELV